VTRKWRKREKNKTKEMIKYKRCKCKVKRATQRLKRKMTSKSLASSPIGERLCKESQLLCC
jgi:hypothetical protein